MNHDSWLVIAQRIERLQHRSRLGLVDYCLTSGSSLSLNSEFCLLGFGSGNIFLFGIVFPLKSAALLPSIKPSW
ncbi:hypothetical protein Q3G72_012003 [Acer saccharum]|nr:hypothetical protein Q3G72_012003 [Acer saccharum]